MVLVGEGVFETVKVLDSQPFGITRHIERMAKAAATLAMPTPQVDSVRAAVEQHLRDRPLELGRLRFTWLATVGSAELTLTSEAMPVPSASATLTFDGWAVDEHGPLAGIKSTHYENFAASRQRALTTGADDALLANRAGDLCEASTANVFYVLDGVLCTPTLGSGCLPGIARGLVIELCDVVEVDRPIADLREASEVFLTSSLREVQPVRRIGDREYEAPGPITTGATDAWNRLASVSWDPPPAHGPR